MNQHETYRAILRAFPYSPTKAQIDLTEKLAGFLCSPERDSLFVMRGYAGTGKTTIVSSLVQILPLLTMQSVLLAPTGRAAKVLASYSGKQAFTIHKKIYRMQSGAEGIPSMVLRQNKHKNTIFLVDEASMIPWESTSHGSKFGGARLLDDLMHYIYNQKGCRVIFIGDTAQLPPVGSLDSPALNPEFLRQRFEITPLEYELRDVVRQAGESGVLFNATLLREMIRKGQETFPHFRIKSFNDIIRLDNQEAADLVNEAYHEQGPGNALIICRSNKRANLYNNYIRNQVLYMEDQINAGDLLMVVKNNYFWLPETSGSGFIANGDILELKRILRVEEVHGFRFASASFVLTDYPDLPPIEGKLLLNTIESQGPALSREDHHRLFESVSEDYQHIANKRTRMAAIMNDPFLNALQVKFAYAMTCHKSQGGQWPHVFVEMGYMKNKTPDIEYLRWLYTAVTRSTRRVYMMQFTDDFFES